MEDKDFKKIKKVFKKVLKFELDQKVTNLKRSRECVISNISIERKGDVRYGITYGENEYYEVVNENELN